MKKISKSMAKKIALMVMLSSAVGMHSVWAETTPTDVIPTDLTKNKVVVTAGGFTINGNDGTGASPYGSVKGGYSLNQGGSEEVKDNILIITGGEFKSYVYGGGTDGDGSVSSNIVTITGGDFTASDQKIYGGYAEKSGKVSGNQINITGGKISQTVYGGWAKSGDASENIVMISGAETKITSKIYGAAGEGAVKNNAVIVTGGTLETAYADAIIGGYAYEEDASNNKVVISGAAVLDCAGATIYGGKVDGTTEDSEDNLVQITTTTGSVKVTTLAGGNSERSNAGNTLIIGDTDVTTHDVMNFEEYYFCIPDSAKDGDTLLNNDTSFIFDGALCVQPKYSEEEYTVTLAKATYGDCCGWELPTGNSVNCTVSQDGEYVKYSQTGIISWVNVFPGSLTNNVVEVTSDTTATVNGTTQALKSIDPSVTNWQSVYGGYSRVMYAYVMDNNVTITDGCVGQVEGGYSSGGTVMNNRVTITGGTVLGVDGGYDESQGTAKDNLVVISGGTINGDVKGGSAKGGYTATGNTVVITGGTFANTVEICGGYCSGVGTVDTSDNTVQISAPITVSKMEGSNQSATGNTLIVDAKGASATTVEGFKNCAFYLPKDTPKDTDAGALMTVGGTMNVSPSIYVVPDYSLTAGTKYKLISTESWAGGSPGGIKYDLAPNNTMSSETPTVAVESNNLVYTMGTISQWRSVQPSSLTGNKVELVANVSGKATAIVNGTTQTCKRSEEMSFLESRWDEVYGGYSTMKGAYVANNTVTISSGEGLEGLSGGVCIYGGYAPNGRVENNTLEVTVAGVEVKSVDGFDNYNFTLPSTTEDGFMLSITRDFVDDFQGDTITVNLNSSEIPSIVLIQNKFASSLDGITLKVTEDGTTFVSEDDAKGCFSVTSPETGYYSLVFTNNLGISLQPTAATGNNITVIGDRTATGYTGDVPPEGKTWKHVYGGYSKDGDVTGNTLTITAGTIGGNVYAGYSKNPDATVSGNKLYWQGGTVKGGMIKGNEVTISGTEAKYLGTEGTIEADEAVELTGTLTVGDAETESALTFASGVNAAAGSELKIANENGTVTLEKDSTIGGNVTGDGTLEIADGVVLNTTGGKISTGITGDGSLVVKSGTLVYEAEEGKTIDVPVIIEKYGTMDPKADVFQNDVTNYGTLVLEGGNLTQTVSNIGGTMKVTSPVTIGTNGAVTLDAGSTLAIAAASFTTDAAVKGITSTNFTLADGAKIKLTGDTDDETYYTLLAGENTAIVDLVSKVSDGLVDETGEQFTESDVKTNGDGTAIIAKVSTLNVDEMNLNSLAGIQQGMVSMQNITVDTVAAHMGLINKAKGEGKYVKEIWASYLNNKDNVDGFNMAKYDAKYNGVTVGVDFYSSEKSVAGVALTYAKGDVSGNGIKSGIRNDSKYYGISFYDRVDLKNSALLMDLGYMNSKNETNVSTTKSVTGDAKVDSYTLGVRWEKDYKFKNSKLVPFAGVRYLRLNSKDFGNSRGLNYSTNSQNLFQPKIGVAWAGDYKMNDNGWNFKPKAEVGYLWALGNREADTALNYKGHDKGNVLYDVTDKSSYYAKLGIEFNKKNFAAGVDYSYMKGSSVRSNRWNVNLSWSF